MRRVMKRKCAPEPINEIEEPAYRDYDESNDLPPAQLAHAALT
jgi:hypothetical protein